MLEEGKVPQGTVERQEQHEELQAEKLQVVKVDTEAIPG